MRLTDKYKPKSVDDFIGIENVKKTVRKYLDHPDSRAFLFVGESGTGKTAMAECIAQSLNGETSPFNYIRIDSQENTVAKVREITQRLLYAPWGAFWVVHVDEAAEMSQAAQTAWLSILDHIPERVVIIFTTNGDAKQKVLFFEHGNLEPRFVSRCTVVQFSNYGMLEAATAFLSRVAEREEIPVNGSIGRILKDCRNNIRASLNALESIGGAA